MTARLLPLLALLLVLAAPSEGAEAGGAAAAYERHRQRIRSLLDRACREGGLPPARLGFRPRDLSLMRDPFRPAGFDAFLGDPLFFKVHCDTYAAALRSSAADPAAVYRILCRLADVAFSARPGGPAPQAPAPDLRASLEAVFAAAGADASGVEAAARALEPLPAPLRAALARFLGEAARAARLYAAAFGAAGEEKAARWFTAHDDAWSGPGGFRQEVYDFCLRLDRASVLLAGRVALEAGLSLAAFLRESFGTAEARAAVAAVRAETPMGLIVVAGPGEDVHAPGRYLLLADLGGDDAYGAGAGGAGRGQYVSVCVDLGGRDRYEAGEDAAPSFGAGFLGLGLLVDVSGDDTYEAHGRAMGSASFGGGILWDEAGSDRYTLDRGGQACARMGVAALVDGGGDDVYTCFGLGQGVGMTGGAAALVDGAGDDTYTARDDEIRHPSAQSPEHNSSLAQGCGFGRRADMTDGHSASGGTGLLVDASGDDTYSGGVMAQAHGYWYGLGVLSDGEGNDRYRAAWYGQSSSAHFGLSYLRDESGNDRYETLISQNLGNGRDLSLSWFEDDEGDDIYAVVDRGGGCGDVNGIGLFFDLSGDDSYAVTSAAALGFARLQARSPLRREIPTLGFFLDAGGTDTYSFPRKGQRRKGPADGAVWKGRRTRWEVGVGLDTGSDRGADEAPARPLDGGFTSFAFHSGGANHIEGHGEWKYLFRAGSRLEIRHEKEGRTVFETACALSKKENETLRRLVKDLRLAERASSTRPGVPDEVMYTFLLRGPGGERKVLVWVRDALKDPVIVELVAFLEDLTARRTGRTPVLK